MMYLYVMVILRLSLIFMSTMSMTFDILIGHPLEKLFLEARRLGTFDVKLGRETFSIPISRMKNSPAELLPEPEPVEEVMAISPFEPSESSLEKDAELFIQEEDDSGETLEIPTDERPFVGAYQRHQR